jgi:AmiR/NasT family two-component response regulator
MAYLVKPVGPEDLGPAVSLAWWRFGRFQSACRDTTGLPQAPEERQAIERPKAGLMKQALEGGTSRDN